jgi:hypothetical protein
MGGRSRPCISIKSNLRVIARFYLYSLTFRARRFLLASSALKRRWQFVSSLRWEVSKPRVFKHNGSISQSYIVLLYTLSSSSNLQLPLPRHLPMPQRITHRRLLRPLLQSVVQHESVNSLLEEKGRERNIEKAHFSTSTAIMQPSTKSARYCFHETGGDESYLLGMMCSLTSWGLSSRMSEEGIQRL